MKSTQVCQVCPINIWKNLNWCQINEMENRFQCSNTTTPLHETARNEASHSPKMIHYTDFQITCRCNQADAIVASCHFNWNRITNKNATIADEQNLNFKIKKCKQVSDNKYDTTDSQIQVKKRSKLLFYANFSFLWCKNETRRYRNYK